MKKAEIFFLKILKNIEKANPVSLLKNIFKIHVYFKICKTEKRIKWENGKDK